MWCHESKLICKVMPAHRIHFTLKEAFILYNKLWCIGRVISFIFKHHLDLFCVLSRKHKYTDWKKQQQIFKALLYFSKLGRSELVFKLKTTVKSVAGASLWWPSLFPHCHFASYLISVWRHSSFTPLGCSTGNQQPECKVTKTNPHLITPAAPPIPL